MAGAGQYEDAFRPQRLQNWSVAHPGPQRPSPRVGSTRIIADDRGHLLPSVSRSQASPWGTFVGTWEMPARIPPARLDLSSRSATAAARLTQWVRQPTVLTRARNGLRTDITGKPQEPRSEAQTTKEPSGRSIPASSEGIPRAGVMPAEPTDPGAGAAAPPGCTERRLEEKASPEPPALLQPLRKSSHQPVATEQRGDSGSPRTPQTPASLRPASREASAPQAILPPAPDPSPRHGSSGLGASAAGERAGQTPQRRGGSALRPSASRQASRDSQKPPSQGDEGKASEKP
ncbi:protein Flattop [Phaenicophaeus curvirostris]|uniref:protein Flattop n=1 Tax=Phaenicophaeus curvirostris TaxID=33595 RepID=UPI0037F0FD8C